MILGSAVQGVKQCPPFQADISMAERQSKHNRNKGFLQPTASCPMHGDPFFAARSVFKSWQFALEIQCKLSPVIFSVEILAKAARYIYGKFSNTRRMPKYSRCASREEVKSRDESA